MANFAYTARDRQGVVQTGHLDALDEDEVVGTLQSKGLIVTAVSRRQAGPATSTPVRKPMARRLHRRTSPDDKVLFCQQLAVLLEGGIPLLKCLKVLASQVESRTLLNAIEEMYTHVEAGCSLRDAMAKHPKIFSSFWVNLIETGEASGHLAQSLNEVARYLVQVRDLQRKALTAVTYPAILIGAAVAALAVFMLKIIPIFGEMFTALGTELPALTQMTIAMSDFVRHHFLFMVLVTAGAAYAIKGFVRTERGRWMIDRCALRVPVFSQLFIQLQLAQFARGLTTLLNSGVPILFSLEIMERSATNKVYGQAIGEIRELIRGGKTMAGPMEQTGMFPPMVVQMVQVGEEIGELSKMLERVARYYEERVTMFVERLTVLFEPFAIVVMAVLIGFLVISMFLPIFSMASGARMG